jgi:hypothetical protein
MRQGDRSAHEADAPVPASQPMSEELAEWYVARTGGQLKAFHAADGRWYLYTPNADEPESPNGRMGGRRP